MTLRRQRNAAAKFSFVAGQLSELPLAMPALRAHPGLSHKHRKIETLSWLTQALYDTGCSEDIQTVDTQFGRIGLTICADNFDLKHPRRVAELGHITRTRPMAIVNSLADEPRDHGSIDTALNRSWQSIDWS